MAWSVGSRILVCDGRSTRTVAHQRPYRRRESLVRMGTGVGLALEDLAMDVWTAAPGAPLCRRGLWHVWTQTTWACL